jgi:hypothetical protein
MHILRKWANLITESLQDWDNGKWVHYTDFDALKINLQTSYQDPLGIFCFPEKFVPKTNMWLNMKYKIILTLKPSANILDLSKITDEQLKALTDATNCTEKFNAYIEQYPPESHDRKIKMAWEQMRNAQILSFNGTGSKAKWNKAFRDCGWDAIFDDTGSIHSSEVQLLILNPRIIEKIDRKLQSTGGFEAMNKVVADMKTMLQEFGRVEIEGPKKMSDGWSSQKILLTKIKVEKSEENYVNFVIRYDPVNQKNMIGIHLQYSRPSLGYGVGAQYDINRDSYGDYMDMNKLKKDVEKIFSTEEIKS